MRASSPLTLEVLDDGEEQGELSPEENANYTVRRRRVYRRLRDRKVALFIDNLPEGVWEIRYQLRAETPGGFHALPIISHTMYAPEIRANSVRDLLHRGGRNNATEPPADTEQKEKRSFSLDDLFSTLFCGGSVAISSAIEFFVSPFLNDLSPARRLTCPAHFFASAQKTVDKQCRVGVFDTC